MSSPSPQQPELLRSPHPLADVARQVSALDVRVGVRAALAQRHDVVDARRLRVWPPLRPLDLLAAELAAPGVPLEHDQAVDVLADCGPGDAALAVLAAQPLPVALGLTGQAQ